MDHYKKIQKLPSIYKYLPKWIIVRMQMRNIQRAANHQGIGRHSKAEVIEMGIKDLRTLSYFLGDF